MAESRRKRSIRKRVLAEWRGFPEPRDTSHHLRSVGDLIPGVLGRMGVRERVLEEQLSAAWASIVGPFVAQHSRPMRLERRTLFVGVSQPAMLYTLDREMKPRILALLTERFGGEVIRGIRFVNG